MLHLHKITLGQLDIFLVFRITIQDPPLTLAGAELYQWIGQTYRNTTQPFEIASGTNDESTSSSVISTQYKNYATLDGASTYLTSGVPNANTGKTSGTKYAIGDQSIAITSSSVAAVETIKFRATNVNGTGSYAELTGTKVQVHTATPAVLEKMLLLCLTV